jgi:hypothetical protein
MKQFDESLIALNTLENDPNMRGSIPLVGQLVLIDPAAMVDGIITVTLTSPFGKNKGEVFGILPLLTKGGNNEVLGFSAAAGTDAGTVTVTIHSDAANSTTNLAAFYIIVVGKIHPTNPA